jgi:Fic family protein
MKKTEPPPQTTGMISQNILKLLYKKDINAEISRINDKYLYWDKVKYLNISGVDDPKLLWTIIKLSRSLHAKFISFGKYNFKYNSTDYLQKTLHEFDLNIGGTLGTKSLIPEDDKKRYLVSSIMEEAIASSQIEGAVTTRKAAKEMLRKNRSPRNKSEHMIVNNYVTIKHIVDTKDEPLTIERLLDLHQLITSQTLENPLYEGKFRDNNEVRVVDAIDNEVVYSPPDFNEIPELVNQLISFFNNDDATPFIHPIIKGCIIHFMTGFIHPFVDGNGRTARALFYWYLLKSGYWLTEYLSISRLIVKSKTQYAQAYLWSETDENDLTYFLTYKLKTMQLAYASLREYIQRKIKEKKQVVNFQKISGINERQALILKWFYEEADLLLSVKEVETRFAVSNQTARNDLVSLENLGYLEMIELNKKTQGFCRSMRFLELLETNLSKID